MTNSAQIADKLSGLLGSTYVLYVKTHGYHWNVTGPQFRSLHLLFEEQYTQQWQSLDELAERIRALGATAPGSSRAMAELSSIDEADNDVPSWNGMLQTLIADHSKWIDEAREVLELASDNGDAATEDLIGSLLVEHEKARWMLKSSLEDA